MDGSWRLGRGNARMRWGGYGGSTGYFLSAMVFEIFDCEYVVCRDSFLFHERLKVYRHRDRLSTPFR